MIGLAVLLAAQAASAVTPEEAHRLPVAELARRVLGDAGALAIDVDRPAWPVCGGINGPRCPEAPPSGPPPLSQSLTFYDRPQAATDISDWRGLCSSQTLKVIYNDNAAFDRLEVGARFTAPAGLRREPNPRDYAAWLVGANAACAAVGPVKSFFYAGDATTAYRGLIGITLFKAAIATGKPLTFRFACSQSRIAVNDCTRTIKRSDWPGILSFAHVREVLQESCTPNGDLSFYGNHACYAGHLAHDGEEVHLELDQANTAPRLVAFSYGDDMVLY